ncbi:hypothetical protein, partial [Algoriphagus boritolerans]|uniref:hypothetical protein n=1 Tax=Algoriphagus boritolerans TaxID=308111 RepID=UPI000AA1E7DB
VSLLHLIPEELRTNFLAYEIHYLNGYILLRTLDHHLIRLEFGEDFTLKSLKSWQVETRFGTSFVMENNFYVRQADKGLYRLEGDEIKLIPGTEFFGKEPLAIMLPYLDSNENQLLLGSPFSGFYLFDGTSVSKFPTQVDQLIKEGAGRLLHALAYQGNYILSFTGAGIVIMNPKGELLNRIGTEQGLPTDVVRNVYLDRGQGLWATTEDGIARISIGSPIQTFGKDLGITSFVSSIQKQGKDFYLGTSNGLVKFDQKINAFKSVPGYNTFGSGFLNFDGQDLIVANGPSLEVITAGKTIKLDFPKDGSIPFSTLIPKHNPNFLLVGTTTGLLVYERGLSKEFPWELKGKAPEIGPTEFLFEGKDGRIFTSGAGKINALRIEENKLESKGALPIKSKAFEVSTSSPFSLIEGEFYVRSSEGFQKFSEKEQDFLPTDDFEAVEAEIRDFNQ